LTLENSVNFGSVPFISSEVLGLLHTFFHAFQQWHQARFNALSTSEVGFGGVRVRRTEY